MRIDLGSLDPASPLAQRIHAALARETHASMVIHGVDADFGGSRHSGGQDVKSPPRVKFRGPPAKSEEDLHRAIVGMIAIEARPGIIAFHVPNGGRRGKAEAGRLKGMGTLSGIPDLIVLANGHAHGLEIKTDKGRLSGAQKRMAERFARAGVPYEVARSVAGARMILKRWGAIA